MPLNYGNYYSVWACVSNAVLVPLPHHSLRKLSFRYEVFSETGSRVSGTTKPHHYVAQAGLPLLRAAEATMGGNTID